MRLLLLFVPLLLTLGSACNRTVGGRDGADGISATSKASKVIRELENNRFTTEFLEGKARVKVESEKLNIGGTAVVRLERDKAIWVSVKKFGFEGARALIRPDSFFFVNRLNGDYTAEPLAYIEEKYKIPARFDLLQEIFLGNAVFFSKDLKLETSGETFLLSGRDDRFATQHRVSTRGYRLEGMTLTELGQNRTLVIENEDFRPVEGLSGRPDFPHERTVKVDAGRQSGTLNLEYSRLSFSGPLAMPFVVR